MWIQTASSGSWRNEIECDFFAAAGAHDEDEDEHHEDESHDEDEDEHMVMRLDTCDDIILDKMVLVGRR